MAVEWRPAASLDTLRRRAELVTRTRSFFAARGALEVDTPVLQGGANLDPSIAPIAVDAGVPRFLPTSPEHPLKRLVAAGFGAVWTLAPVFRRGERSARHQPEFRMLEWYRPDWDHLRLLDEVVELLDHLAGWGRSCEVLPYRDAFTKHAGIDPEIAGDAELERLLGAAWAEIGGDRDAAIDLLLATKVEPQLGRGGLTAIVDYPPRLAAQARLRAGPDGRRSAARFELYKDGFELANGYSELTDASELGERLGHELDARGDGALRRDQRFEAAIAAGLPDCAGVALGFDRVVMLALGLPEVARTMAFPWELA
jgi:lysyl-tRNA synthetase class 2